MTILDDLKTRIQKAQQQSSSSGKKELKRCNTELKPRHNPNKNDPAYVSRACSKDFQPFQEKGKKETKTEILFLSHTSVYNHTTIFH